MGFKEVSPAKTGLVAMQRQGLLFWWDIRYRESEFAALPHRLARQRQDMTEEILKRWAMRGELFTYEPDTTKPHL